MKIIRNIVAIQLAIMIILTSGGLTIVLNLCGCTHEANVSVLSAPNACCGMSTSCDSEKVAVPSNSIGEESCCKTIVSYQKLSETVISATVSPILTAIVVQLPDILVEKPNNQVSAASCTNPPPILRSGKELVLFLNNPKIPCSQQG